MFTDVRCELRRRRPPRSAPPTGFGAVRSGRRRGRPGRRGHADAADCRYTGHDDRGGAPRRLPHHWYPPQWIEPPSPRRSTRPQQLYMVEHRQISTVRLDCRTMWPRGVSDDRGRRPGSAARRGRRQLRRRTDVGHRPGAGRGRDGHRAFLQHRPRRQGIEPGRRRPAPRRTGHAVHGGRRRRLR